MMNYLPVNIRYLRKKKGQNQAELAQNFGKKQNTVGNWENGVSEPSIKELLILSQIFMVSMEDLVNQDIEKREARQEPGAPAAMTGDSRAQPGLPGSMPYAHALTDADREMDGFWLTIRELRSIHEKLDQLIRLQDPGRGKSFT